MDFRSLIFVFLGGGLGAILRFWVDHWTREVWPNIFGGGVALVNILGCLAIGCVATVMQDGPSKTGVMVGILGGLTTFSSFGLLLDTGIRTERWTATFVQLVIHVVLGVFAVRVGITVGKLFLRP